MKCDRCEQEATVHEVRIEAGKRRERHLCEQCAKSEGVAPAQGGAPLTSLLQSFMLQQGEAAAPPTSPSPAPTAPAASAQVCPDCGTTFAQFRQSGLLGCAACYGQFEHQLVPLLARAHEGGTGHKGKIPRRLAGVPAAAAPVAGPVRPKPSAPPRSPASIDPQAVAKLLAERILMLKKRLAEAVEAEEYETAAKLRDELARLEGMPQSGALSPPPASKRRGRSSGDSAEPPGHPDAPPGESGGAP